MCLCQANYIYSPFVHIPKKRKKTFLSPHFLSQYCHEIDNIDIKSLCVVLYSYYTVIIARVCVCVCKYVCVRRCMKHCRIICILFHYLTISWYIILASAKVMNLHFRMNITWIFILVLESSRIESYFEEDKTSPPFSVHNLVKFLISTQEFSWQFHFWHSSLQWLYSRRYCICFVV